MSHSSDELRAIAASAYDAINAGDLDDFLAVVTDDVEFTSLVAEAEGQTYRGHSGVRAWWETVRGTFSEGSQWELLDFEGHDDRGVVELRISGTIGGAPVEQTMWQAVKARDGKACWWAFFRDEQDARAAAGL
jgi:ketosteroid isomerase-like protein